MIKVHIFLFVQWKKLFVKERIFRDVQLHESLGKSQFVQVIPGDVLVYDLTTEEHERVHLLMPADRLCEVEMDVLVATVASEHTHREFLHNRAIVAE